MTAESSAATAPLVSVVMCVFNAGRYFRPAVESVLRQTYPHFELLVIDDGSTDGAVDEAFLRSDSRIRLYRQPNQGRPAALNRALSLARGEFYAVQDADDLCRPLRLEAQVRCLQDHPETAAVFCGFDLILNDRHVAPRMVDKDPQTCRRDIEMLRMPGHDPTAMYRVSLVKGLSYAEDLKYVEAYDYVLRVGERFPMRSISACLYSYRIHVESITKRDPTARCLAVRECTHRVLLRRGVAVTPEKLPKVPSVEHTSNKDRDNDLVSHFMESMVDLKRAGQLREALRAALTCAGLQRRDAYYYKPLLYALAPLSWIQSYRRLRGSA
jgi:glycosyltransferase involved in cell wall biosynthesis